MWSGAFDGLDFGGLLREVRDSRFETARCHDLRAGSLRSACCLNWLGAQCWLHPLNLRRGVRGCEGRCSPHKPSNVDARHCSSKSPSHLLRLRLNCCLAISGALRHGTRIFDRVELFRVVGSQQSDTAVVHALTSEISSCAFSGLSGSEWSWPGFARCQSCQNPSVTPAALCHALSAKPRNTLPAAQGPPLNRCASPSTV